MGNWKCTICGLVCAGERPVHCPECGARDTMFEPTAEVPHGVEHNPLQPKDEHEQHAIALGPGRGCLESD